MFYYGLRSSSPYLDSLEDIRSHRGRAALTSVVGGFVFLHALHPDIAAITLLDQDPDALLHWRLMAALIDAAESLDDFVSLLAGGRRPLRQQTSAPLRFAPRVSPDARLRARLSPDLFARYRRTYGAIVIDENGEGRIGKARVLFTGHDLARMTFCWHLGRGAFRDDDTFAAMQRVLRSVPVRLLETSFQTFDYTAAAAGQPYHIVLASNCESPLFTTGDAIFRRVARTARVPTRYVSWARDGWVGRAARPAPRHGSGRPERESKGAAPPLVALPSLRGARVLVMSSVALPAVLAGPLAGAPRFRGVDDPRLRAGYAGPMLVIVGGGRSALALLVEIAPAFSRVLWLSPDAAIGATGAAAADLRERYSVAPTHIPGVMHLELKAARPSGGSRTSASRNSLPPAKTFPCG